MKNRNRFLTGTLILSAAMLFGCPIMSFAQMPPEGPGPAIGISPPPGTPEMPPGPAPAPGDPNPAPPEGWVSPGWTNGPNNPEWQNQGSMNVLACGYDSQGVWRVIPLFVSYYYNGVQYNVTVVNAWDPWTDQWNSGVDVPAFNTSFYLNGNTYNFYTQLSTGTYYFNL